MDRHKKGEKKWWDDTPERDGSFFDNGRTRVFSRHHEHAVHDNAPELDDKRGQARANLRGVSEVNSPGPRTNAPSRGWFDAAGNPIHPSKKKNSK